MVLTKQKSLQPYLSRTHQLNVPEEMFNNSTSPCSEDPVIFCALFILKNWEVYVIPNGVAPDDQCKYKCSKTVWIIYCTTFVLSICHISGTLNKHATQAGQLIADSTVEAQVTLHIPPVGNQQTEVNCSRWREVLGTLYTVKICCYK